MCLLSWVGDTMDTLCTKGWSASTGVCTQVPALLIHLLYVLKTFKSFKPLAHRKGIRALSGCTRQVVTIVTATSCLFLYTQHSPFTICLLLHLLCSSLLHCAPLHCATVLPCTVLLCTVHLCTVHCALQQSGCQERQQWLL